MNKRGPVSEPFKIWTVPRWWPDPDAKLDRGLTSAAIEVLDHVKEQAGEWRLAGLVPPSLVLWCVLEALGHEWQTGQAVLEACGVDRVAMERDSEADVASQAGSSADEPDMRSIYEVAVRANEEAATLGHNWVGTEHLVLTLFHDATVARL